MLEQEIIYQSFPIEIRENVVAIFTKFNIETIIPIHKGKTVFSGHDTISIPSRIYWKPPYSLNSNKFTSIEKEIINCIFSRHENGFIRQKAIKNILHSDNYWIIPYVLQIVGEYVIEILNDIYIEFDSINKPNLIEFINQNVEFYNLIKARVQSYWNCYYRGQFPEKIRNIKVSEEQRYVGFQLLNKIENLL